MGEDGWMRQRFTLHLAKTKSLALLGHFTSVA